MNGFLLIAACNFDDIPVAMFKTKSEAVRAAASAKPPKINPLETCDITGFICWKILQFKNGKPIRVTIIERASDASA